MATAAILNVLVMANTNQATRSLLRFQTTMQATESASNKALGAVKTFAKVSAIGAGAGLAFAVKKAADFESQLDSLGAVTEASGRQMEQFRKQAMKAGADTKFSALDAAVAQTELAKGGLRVGQIMRGGLRSALALAAAGELDLGEAAATTANALNLFGLSGNKSMKVADALAKAANATTADVSDFAMALRQSGGVAKTAGLSFTETVLALEALANAGVKNSDAGTSLKTSMIQLLSPSKKQQEVMSRLNLDFTDAAGNFKNLSDVSEMLRKRTEGMTRAQRIAAFATIAGTDGVRTLTALYDAGGPKLDKWRKGLQESGTAAEVAAKKQDNLKGRLENLQGSIETIAISIGSKLLPGLTDAAEKITDILNDPNLTTGQKFDRFTDMITKAISDGLNKAAQVAADAAPRVAAAFARGWFNASIWTKLLVGGFLLSKMGGLKAFAALGATIGRALGLGMATGAASTMVGGAGGGAAAGGLLGGLGGKLLPFAKKVGLAGVGIALADSVISEFGRRSQERGPDMFKALQAAQKSQEVAGVNLRETLPIPFKVIGDVTGESDRIENAKKLEKGLRGIADASSKISPERARELRDQIKALADLSPEVRKAMNGLVGRAEDNFFRLVRATNSVRQSIGLMRDGLVFSTKEMRQAVGSNFNRIVKDIGADTELGRRLLAQNFGAGLQTIKRFMKEGKLSTAQGMKEIARLMDTQSAKGAAGVRQNMDAVRRAIVGTLSRATDITAKQLATLRGLFVTELKLYGLSPKQALAGANVRTGEVRGGRRRQDFQRGGPIDMGAPSGDTVPAMLERGEYVLNRKAVAKAGKRNLDAINFGAAPRFQSGGIAGMVSAANRVDKAQFPFVWGGGHQGSPAPFGPFDCSGAVSYVLQQGGVQIPTMVSGALANAGQPGPGKVTVFADPGHTFMRIGNRYFGTSGTNPGGGAGWFPDPGDAYKSRFTQRHFVGTGDIMSKIGRSVVEGEDSPLKSMVQRGLDATRGGINKRMADLMATSIGGGDVGDPGPLGAISSTQNLRLGKRMAATYGWVKAQWNALKELWTRESGWDNMARNPSSGAFGIPQALPPTKMPKAAQEGDPASQIAWGLQYIKGRYGSPSSALAFHDAHNWYAKGGSVGYTGDSLGQGTAPKLKAILDRVVNSNSVKGRRSSGGLGSLKEQAKHNAQLVFDLGTNDANAGQTRSASRAAALLKKPLHYFTVKSPFDEEAKNRMFRASPGGNEHLVDWAKVAGQYGASSDQPHPNAAGYARRAQMLAASIRRATGQEKPDKGGGEPGKPFGGPLRKVLDKTLKALRTHANAKFRSKRMKQFVNRIKRAATLPKHLTDQMGLFAAAADIAGTNADRAGSLNIENEDGTTTLMPFLGKDQGGWLNDQLAHLLSWRNKIIDAINIVQERRERLRKLLEQARERLEQVKETIKQVAKEQEKRRKELDQLRKKPKQNKDKIAALRKVIMRIDDQQDGRVRERAGLQKIIPTVRGQIVTLGGEEGLGGFQTSLVDVQGPGGSLLKMKTAPPINAIGGTIFDTLLSLQDLATKPSATGSDAPVADSESAELLKQLLREANLRTAVSQAQYDVFKDFDATSGAGLQQFATGGIVQAPAGAPLPVIAHGGEGVFTREQMAAMGGGQPNVSIHVNGDIVNVPRGRDPVEARIDGRRIRVSNRAPLPGAGGGGF